MRACLPMLVSACAIMNGGLAAAADNEPAVRSSAVNPWEVAFGAAWMTDYNIRGITQSARRPTAAAYIESRYAIDPNLQIYGGLYGAGVDLPNRAAAQVVYFAGVRPTLGKLALDLGAWYVHYPGGSSFNGLGGPTTCTNGAFFLGHCNVSKGNISYWEAYAKTTYDLSATVTLGGGIYYAPSVFNTGAPGTYASVTAKVAIPKLAGPPDIGAYVSGELGRYWFGTTDAFYGVPAFPAGVKLPDYTSLNIGLGATWRLFTLDLRYYVTDLSKANCNVQTGAQTATFGGLSAVSPTNPSGLVSNWCSGALIGKLSFDATSNDLK